MKKLQIKLTYHSAVDVITNSSSEIFCRIRSEKFLETIRFELSKILKRELSIETVYDDKGCIDFWIENGSDEEISEDFRALLKGFLNNLVGQNNFEISDHED